MPIYEYRCDSCRRVSEVLQKVGARAPRKCPSCSGRLKKIVSRTSFLLKGGGWYSEGYSKSEKPDTAASKPAEDKTAAKKKAAETKAKKAASA